MQNLLNQIHSHCEHVEWYTAVLCSGSLQEEGINPIAAHVGGTCITNTQFYKKWEATELA